MSLFDVLNSSGLGSALGTLTEKAKSTASTLGREAPGGVGGLLGAYGMVALFQQLLLTPGIIAMVQGSVQTELTVGMLLSPAVFG